MPQPLLSVQAMNRERPPPRSESCFASFRSRPSGCRPLRARGARLLLALLRDAAARQRGEHGAAWSCHRNDPFPLPALRHTGDAEDPTGRTTTRRRPGDASLPVVLSLHLGDRPGPARQGAMVGKPPALSMLAAVVRRLAHTRPCLAAWERCCCILRRRRACPILNSKCSSIHLVLHCRLEEAFPRPHRPMEVALKLLHVLMGLRNGRGCDGMLLVMLALSGWLAPRSRRRPMRGR